MLKNYLLIAYKVLLRRKFFTFISLAGISLTLMILIVYAAFMENMLGTMPPESKGDRILWANHVEFSRDNRSYLSSGGPSYRFLNEYVNIHTLPHIEYASVFSSPMPVEGVYNGRMIRLFRKWTDADYWKILDFNFIEGDPITSDDTQNARFVAVINKSVRKKMFGRGNAIGETITIDGQDFRVIGVVDDVPMYRALPFSEIWVPLSTAKTELYNSESQMGVFSGMVLAKDSAVIPEIRAEYRSRVSAYEYPRFRDYDVATGDLQTFFEFLMFDQIMQDAATLSDFARYSLAMTLIILPTLLFMLLPSLNLMNINLSRIMERSSEIGVRKAFGASSSYLVGQFLVENIILTVIGGGIGLLLSVGLLRLFTTLQLIPYGQFRFNGWIFFYGFAITVVFGLVSGVYPAWKMSRYHPVDALRKSQL